MGLFFVDVLPMMMRRADKLDDTADMHVSGLTLHRIRHSRLFPSVVITKLGMIRGKRRGDSPLSLARINQN